MPKISELNALTTVPGTDYIAVAHDVTGLPSTNKILVSNFANSMTSYIGKANSSVFGVLKLGDGLSVNTSTGRVYTTASIPTEGRSEGKLLTYDANTESPVWQYYAPVYQYTLVNDTNLYTVQEHESLIFVDCNAVSDNITIILPTPTAVQGKEYTIKNIDDAAGAFKVTVTTQDGIDYGSNYIENPETGIFVQEYDLIGKGSGDTWVRDGTVWRHTATQRAVPIFYTSVDTYAQVVFKNASNANNASSDLVGYNNEGNEAEGIGPFVDMGINSNTYTDTTYGNVWGPSDSYLYNYGGNLIIGPQTDHSIKFIAGNTNTQDVKFVVNSTATFITDGNLIVPNYSSIITPTEANTSYAETYFGGGYWGGYTQLDVVGGNSSWSWIETNIQNINNPYVLIENRSDNGSSYTWTFESDGNLTLPGGFNLPTKSMIGWNWNYGLSGPTLQLSNNVTQEVIVTGPVPNSSHPASQRIIIQGQRGYGNWGQNTAGEGGDIYIWGGVGGESDTNTGGSGGDIKVRGGQGQDNEGGYVKIEGGDAAFWNGTAVGDGGFIEITAGDVIESGGDANNHGGNITITAGKARYDSTKSGVITLRVGNNVNNTGTQYSTVFNTDGTISLSANGDIKNSDGISVIKALPQNIQSSFANYTLTLSDAGKHIYKNDGDGYGVEVPTNASVPFEVGTTITIVSGNGWTYIYPVDGMTTEVWGAGYNQTSTSFYIPNNSMATLLKIGTDKWMLSGAGLAID
jgi:hypothetical protein